MQRSEQIAQVKVLLAHLDAGVNVDAGGIRLNPTDSYTDPEIARKERSLFFQTHPQLLGLSGDLPGPGTFITVNDLDTRILATRDDDGQFHAFVNACRHRGVVVEERDAGQARRFICPFHSWTYDPQGSLVGLPKEEHFGSIDKECFGLIELPAEEKYGFLFANPDPAGSLDVEALLGPELSSEMDAWDFGSLVRLGGDCYDVDCNWKLAMETFGETYHFNSLHKDSLAAFFEGNVQCYDSYGQHHRMILCRKAIHEMRKLPEDEWDITIAGLPVYWLFPNTILLPNDFGMYVVRAYPDAHSPGRHRSVITFYAQQDAGRVTQREADKASERRTQIQDAPADALEEIARGFAEIIRDEDYVASASQQRSASSGALPHVVFGRNEPALHHYHNTYRSALGQEPLPLLEA